MSRPTEAGAGVLAADPAEDRVRALTAEVGQRVRAARERASLSRRALSERSGVSERYLAEVEAGRGNISIGLLDRVGRALDRPIAWFLGEADAMGAEALRVAELWRRADPGRRRAALAALGQAAAGRARRIALIGLRGAGKSTLGRRLGARLGLPFVELTDAIEAESGMAVADVIGLWGQEGYRKLEDRALGRVVAAHEAVVLAVAGGIVGSPDAFSTLLENFHTVWLKATPEDHMQRVRAQGDERPMAGNPAAMAELRAILTEREALYGRADATLDTSGRTEDAALEALAALVGAAGVVAD